MKDYLGNETKIGDIVVFNEKASRGYYGSFSRGIVTEISETRHRIKIGKYNSKDEKNFVNLTALGVEFDG